jgi:uncharacterized membrane protein YiaA
MAILDQITVGNQLIIISSADPSVGAGVTAPVGSLILMADGSSAVFKTGALDTNWSRQINTTNLSLITSTGTITSGVWNGTAIADAYISSAATWNAKQNALLGTGFVKSTAGVISYDTNIYLTGNQNITLSGDVTGSGTTAITTSISNTTVTSKLLTGFVSGSGTVAATDSILQAIQKLNGNIALIAGAVVYVGTWNANTNTPALTSGTGTKGYMYKVSVAGTTALDGVTQWNVGDQVVFDGTTWDKIDGVASEVLSVNGLVGAVALTGTSNRITVSAANVFDIAATYVGQTSITTLGTITTGVWNGTAIANANLANSTITIGTTSISLGDSSTVLAGLTSVTSTSFVGALTGNASTATILQNARTINGVSFDGSANIIVTAAALTLTGTILNSTIVTSSLTTVGTLTTGVWNASVIGTPYGGTGTSTTFTAGSAVFAGVSGVYSQDNANYFWDNTNKRLGIAIAAAPVKTLHVGGSTRVEAVSGVTYDIESATVNTTDTTLTTLQTVAIPTGTVVLIEARIHAKKTAGAGVGSVGDGNAYIRTVKAKNVGGVVTIGSVASTYTSEDIISYNATIAVSGTNVIIQVLGDVSDNVTWTSICTITK